MIVNEVMTKNPITVRSDATLGDAARLMLEHRISGLPVLDPSGGLIGILTEADIMRRGEINTARRHARWAELFLSPGRLADEFVRAHARRVDEIMSDPITVDETMPLESAISTMEGNRVKRLPVTRNGKLCGILSRSDLMRAYFEHRAEEEPNRTLSDEEVNAAVTKAIDQCAWSPGWCAHVDVKNGHATLSGCVTDENVRKALKVVVENVPGVREIDDELVTIEPMTGAIVHLPSDPTAGL